MLCSCFKICSVLRIASFTWLLALLMRSCTSQSATNPSKKKSAKVRKSFVSICRLQAIFTSLSSLPRLNGFSFFFFNIVCHKIFTPSSVILLMVTCKQCYNSAYDQDWQSQINQASYHHSDQDHRDDVAK